MKTGAKKKNANVLAFVLMVILALYVLAMVIVLFWTLMTTVKSPTEYNYGPNPEIEFKANTIWLPQAGVTFDNYVKAYTNFFVLVDRESPKPDLQFNILQQFMNSLLFAGGSALMTTLASCIMGYATARFKYRFSGVIYAFVLVTMSLPIVGSLPSEIAVANTLGIFGTFPGIWIMRFSFLNTYYLIFDAQFRMIPKDYTEAAKIDGANHFTIMTKIIMPLAMGTITTVFILVFIAHWNDFQVPMIYLEEHPVAAVGMYKFGYAPNKEVDEIPIRLAGICLLALPIVVLYAIFNKKLSVNLSVGGIKG